MTYDPRKHHRRSIRLPEYDYSSPGAYFVTICVQGKECVLGEIVDGEMRLSEWGRIVDEYWDAVPEHYPEVRIDARITMPNHAHAIIEIMGDRTGAVAAPNPATPDPATPNAGRDDDRGGDRGEETSPLRTGAVAAPNPATPTLGKIVAYFKYQTTKRINALRGAPGVRFWQRNYWEHVVRDEADLHRIRQYIRDNPARWSDDQLRPVEPRQSFNRK